MKKYIIWFDTNSTPPNDDGVFILDLIKAIIIESKSLEDAKLAAIEFEKRSFSNCNNTGKLKSIISVEEYK